ncbi:DUF3025 domain-containing protein [Tahibacter amnicola]|uniref:DUF3025 domain-containing protein n=1 Tax=Tahibacter amnicola TaxID=2976241 RepID=A0ABY6BJB8_9GAMM|nr:DUF3025 domain-containing protein [Tahibacter amnicola]UXI69562.1 DUF3025 domain-containing protein [Tahibacter amnicola]
MRFVAPARGRVDPRAFATPPLAQWAAFEDWLAAHEWPDVDALNRRLSPGTGIHFVAQTPELVADDLHYELRIHRDRLVPTRPDNWHDFFNALIWHRFAPIKAALNARQVDEIARMGPKARSRPQCALTHFDEGGVIVVLRDCALLSLWDAHDWGALFWRERAAWQDGRARALVFGHALLEMALVHDKVITGKAIAVIDSGSDDQQVISVVAAAIARGLLLQDPQELRPLPISGIPGWHSATSDEAFYRDGPCFRPLRPGRTYPLPLRVTPGADSAS